MLNFYTDPYEMMEYNPQLLMHGLVSEANFLLYVTLCLIQRDGQYRIDAQATPTMLNCLMYKLSYYRSVCSLSFILASYQYAMIKICFPTSYFVFSSVGLSRQMLQALTRSGEQK